VVTTTIIDPDAVVVDRWLLGEAPVLERVADHLAGRQRRHWSAALADERFLLEIGPVVDIEVAGVVLDHRPHGVRSLGARPEGARLAVPFKAVAEPPPVRLGLGQDVGPASVVHPHALPMESQKLFVRILHANASQSTPVIGMGGRLSMSERTI